jgi:serine/threonine protein kinase
MIGRTISHYRITRKLGAGGMGEVYLADDLALSRQVALKLLPSEHTQDAERLRRFRQEARAASALNHPNILTIHEVGEADGRHFIATEFVDGESLRATLTRSGRLETREALRVAAQVASALAAAHQAGIVHRDIKPENVMLRPDGYAKVLDFGIAKLTQPAGGDGGETGPTPETASGMVLGTTAYMSPEQATGGKVDPRSDIFSFGALLYELVAGAPAFQRATPMETVAAIIAREPAPLPAGVPADLGRLILRCLRKDPTRRYQTMADLKVALEDTQEEPGITARRRSQLLRWTGAALVLFTLAGAFLLWRRPWSGRGPAEAVAAVPLTTLPGITRYPSFSPDGDRVAFTWSGGHQDNPDVYVQQIGSGSPFRLTADSANDFNPAWSPDGRWIAFLRSHAEAGRSEVRLVPALGGPERKLGEIVIRGGLSTTPPYLAWCPDTSCLVVTDSPGESQPDALFVLSFETGEKRQLTHPGPPAAGDVHPAISPDGRSLVFRRMAGLFVGELYLLPLANGMAATGDPRRLTIAALDAQHPAWLPNGREILFSAHSSLWRLSTAGAPGAPARLPFVGEYGLMPAVSHPARGRDSRLVYVRSFDDGNIWRIQTPAPGAAATEPPALAIASTRLEDMPQFSPDGGRVAFTSDRSGDWEIWHTDPDGANPVQLTFMAAAAAGYPHWSPDGERIAFHSNVDGQWEIYVVPAAGGKARNLTAHPAADAMPSYSRDGRWIYFGSTRAGGTQETIWKMPASGGEAVQVTRTTGHAPQESPDGADLYYVDALDRPAALWRVPVPGGTPAKVLDGVVLANYAVLPGGIYFVDRPTGGGGIHYVDVPSGETRLRWFDLATRRITTVSANLGLVDVPIAVSADGRTILFPRLDSSINDLMLVGSFR